MADLVTHAAVALLVKAATGRRHTAVFVAGSFLPDVLSRVPAALLSWVHREVVSLPDVALLGWPFLHALPGMTAVAWSLAFAFREEVRAAVFRNLLGGMLLHQALDVFQSHHGVGYRMLSPFSLVRFELGWIGVEDTVFVAPVLAVSALVAWWGDVRAIALRARIGRAGRAKADPSSET